MAILGARLSPFQRLALATTAATYLLILVGGLVRASGAGLGCPDWPRCFGTWVPPLSAAALPAGFDPRQFNAALMWTEYMNRLLGMAVGLLILATCVTAWRRHRREPHIVWPVCAALLLTGYEGWLGGRVVAHELAPWIVTAHLVVALVIVSLLLYATVYALFAHGGHPVVVHTERAALARATAALIAVTLAQVAIGTQVRGTIDDALAHDVPRAAALESVGALDAWHRDTSLLVLGGTVALAFMVWTRYSHEPVLQRLVHVSLGLVALQIAIGVVLAYAALPPPAQVVHLGLASLLLGAHTVLFLLARWLPAPS